MNDDQRDTSPPEQIQPDETQPVRAAAAEPQAPPAAAPAGRRGFRERLRSLRRSSGSRTFGAGALIASALAGIIVGGLGAAAVHAVTDDGPGDRGGWVHRDGGDGRGFGDRGGMRGGVPGQLPPTTPPEGEGSES